MEVLLGLLAIEPMSGYDLGLTIRESIGYFWNESYGQIYPNLKRLADDGYASAKTERQKGKPDRRVYSIAKKGRERLVAWLAVEPQSEVPRNELLLKLFFGGQASPETCIGYLERMVERERGLLKQFKRSEKEIARNGQYPGAPYWKMVARYGHLELEAHLQWAQETLEVLRKLARKQALDSEAGKESHHAAE